MLERFVLVGCKLDEKHFMVLVELLILPGREMCSVIICFLYVGIRC